MIVLLFVIPAALAVLALLFRNKLFNRLALAVYAVLHGALAALIFSGNSFFFLPPVFTQYLYLDSLGKLFLLTLTTVNAGVTLSCLPYLKAKNFSRRQDSLFTAFMLIFLVSMTGGIVASHLGLLWVFVEATTLAGGVLIAIEREKSALEAVWKYIFICSIGVAFSFIGIIVLSLGSKSLGSLFFMDLYRGAAAINPFLLKLAFAFIIVGFGTKAGLAPVHAWLPDAHAEAPSPVSALLSGALLNVALLGLFRFYPVMTAAGLKPFAGSLLLIMGGLSLLVSTAYILTSRNYKRLLAYSSIENMGIIAIGLGVGGGALFAAILHALLHSLAKAGLFLTTGNIHHYYRSKRVADVRGLLKVDGKTGWLWILGFTAIVGFPPFGLFFSKFFLVSAMVGEGYAWLAAPFLLLLVIIAFGLGRSVFPMAWGEAPELTQVRPLPVAAWLPSLFFLAVLLLFGLFIPPAVQSLITDVQHLFLSFEVK